MTRRKQGGLIIFEGPDGVGKTTVAEAVQAALVGRDVPCAVAAFPGRAAGSLGQLVYELHHDPSQFGISAWTQASQQALHIAAHLDAIERVIVPALCAGRHVLLDRFWWSTWVYGTVGGVGRHVLRRLIDAELAQWGTVRPTLAILLRRETPIDRDLDVETWSALRREYDHLAHREQVRYPVLVVDNRGPLHETVARITAEVSRRLRAPQPGEVPAPLEPPSQLRFELGEIPAPGPRPVAPTILSRIPRARPSAVYDTYWRFAAERQRIFFERLAGTPPPWTDDPILARYKFTNAYRASDRVSQYLIRQVIYRSDLPASADEVCFRVLLFKFFNRIETWELLERALGSLTYADYRFDHYDAVLSEALRAGQRIYSAAYIMPPGRGAFGEAVKHRTHLRLLERMMADELPKRLTAAQSMQQGFTLLRAYPTIGDFLAYQLITDINYSELTHFTEMEFVVPGPGALDGIRKCFLDCGGLNAPEIIRLMADQQTAEFARLGLSFRSLWGRPLQLIDHQNLFCEVGKYARVAHPEAAGESGRTRIKRHFTPSATPIQYWYPPKWRLNEAVAGASPGQGSGAAAGTR